MQLRPDPLPQDAAQLNLLHAKAGKADVLKQTDGSSSVNNRDFCLRILEGEHHVGRHQHNSPVFPGTLVDTRLESRAGVQDEVVIFHATAILGSSGTPDQRVEDVRPDRSATPLALAVQHRAVEQAPGYIDVVVDTPDLADLLGRGREGFLCMAARVPPTDFLERAAHVLVQLRHHLMPPDIVAEALHHA